MIRLRSPIGTQAFVEEYQRARDGLTTTTETPARIVRAEQGTLRGLIEGYYKSANFKSLGLTTQRARRGILDHICESVVDTPAGPRARGALPFAQMMARHVRAIRDEKLDLPEAANGRIKALGQVFRWAIENDLTDTDPTAAVDYLSSGSEGFHTWTVEEVRQYEIVHPIGTKARLVSLDKPRAAVSILTLFSIATTLAFWAIAIDELPYRSISKYGFENWRRLIATAEAMNWAKALE